jgi:hypothetical protein
MTRAVSFRQLRGGQPLTGKDSTHRAGLCTHFPLFKARPRYADSPVDPGTLNKTEQPMIGRGNL